MTVDTFFEKFEEFADAPGAVERMRELVLDLAVQGKLLRQDSGDQPAKEILIRIYEDRATKIDASLKKKLKVLDPLVPEEYPHQLPSGWAWCKLGMLGLIGSSRRVHQKDWKTSGVPFFRAREIVKLAKFGRVDNDLFISEEHFVRLASEGLIPEENDLMITGVGTIGIPYVVKRTDRFYFKDASVLIFKNCFDLLPLYLHLVMRSPYWKQKIHEGSMGTTVHTFTVSRAQATPIPLPPLAEQKRIVAKVDELMALCDQLEAQQQERDTRADQLARASLARFAEAPTPANLNFLFHPSYTISPADLRKSILTLAVQGKLVEQDTKDESAEKLLKNIELERLAAVKKKRIRAMKVLHPIEENEIRFRLQPGWAYARIVELVMEIQTGPFGSSLHKSDYEVGGTPVINPASLKDGRIIPIETMAISSEKLSQLGTFRLDEGDIVLARRGEMGRCAVVTSTENGWLCGTGSLVLRMPSNMYSPFLALLIGAPESRQYLGGASVGATMQNLNQSILARMPIAIPPLAEQKRIVAKVDELMALVDELETQLADSRATAKNLLEALVAELTPAGAPNPIKSTT